MIDDLHEYFKNRVREDVGPPGREEWEWRPYCRVASCSQCKRIGPTGHVKRWWLLTSVVRERYEIDNPVLCMGCMNKSRSIWNVVRQYEENRILMGRIKIVIREARKHNKEAVDAEK